MGSPPASTRSRWRSPPTPGPASCSPGSRSTPVCTRGPRSPAGSVPTFWRRARARRCATPSTSYAAPSGPDALVTTRDAVGLADGVAVDLARARAAAAAGDLASAAERGPLLDGLDADWAIAAREDYAAEVGARLAALATADPTHAIRWARRRIEVEPRSEAAHRELIRLLAERGDRPAALAAYDALAARLRRELGLAPSEETRALAGAIRRGHTRPSLEQGIRFATVRGRRVAYAKVGAGPLLVLPAMWISHLEEEWTFPELRAFIEALGAEHTVVRYDRLGTGLSDRDGPPPGWAPSSRPSPR